MPKIIDEIMNRELLLVHESERVSDVLHYLVSLGISGAPVVDGDRRPIGFVSWRDLVDRPGALPVGRFMNVPVDTLRQGATLDDAAALLCDHSRHHVVCVGADGRVVGFVAVLDVLRGLTGRPSAHPTSFPHWDSTVGLSWSNEFVLDSAAVREHAPVGPGLFVLVLPVADGPNRVVWSSAVADVQGHLLTMLTAPGAAPPHLADLVSGTGLWFRTARAPSARALLEVT